tara:strand:+ start:1830 stop:2003 length:174 start_codon:yes stop_codon:yes gene_type:complete
MAREALAALAGVPGAMGDGRGIGAADADLAGPVAAAAISLTMLDFTFRLGSAGNPID